MVSNYELIKVGEQATPIVVIDGFIPDPLSLVETIAQHHPFTKQDGDFYPGVRSHPPQEYVKHLHTSLPLLVFGGPNGGRWYDYLDGGLDTLEDTQGQHASGYNMNQFLLAVLHHFGLDDETFGEMQPDMNQEPLSEIFS